MLILTPEQIQQAPEEVCSWIHAILFHTPAPPISLHHERKEEDSSPPPVEKPKETTPGPEKVTEPDPTLDDLIVRVTDLANAGQGLTIKKILGEMGLDRVSECPPEHIPEFLSRLAGA